MRIETVIVVISLASMAVVVVGAAGVMREWAKPYHGHHHRPVPSLRVRVAAALLVCWREMAIAHALMTGAAAPHPTVLVGGTQ